MVLDMFWTALRAEAVGSFVVDTGTPYVVGLTSAADASGIDDPRVLELASVAAHFQSGIPNPLDDAIRGMGHRKGRNQHGE